MSERGATILHDGVAAPASRVRVSGNELWLPVEDLVSAAGWELKPEGVCRGEICVPLPPGNRDRILRQLDSSTWFNLTEFARLIEQPVANDLEARTWSLGPPGWDWKAPVTKVIAPDFAAPDLMGRRYSLHDVLGRKLFFLFWASW
jgi:hypothetical protein